MWRCVLVLPAASDSTRWWLGRGGRGELSVERIEILDLLLGDGEGRKGERERESEERSDEKVGGEARGDTRRRRRT